MPKKCVYSDAAKKICRQNGYEYIGFIDAGVYKETYKIRIQNSLYALKVFKPEKKSERCGREIEAMRRLQCSNIARLICVDELVDGTLSILYFVEEYLDGGTLTQHIGSGALTIGAAVKIGHNMISALEETYAERIVHRDIKPDNIMFRVTDTGLEAVLVDFGLVRDLDASSLTQAFQIRGPGSPYFAAPEQLNNEKPLIDWRTDQFSLAVTLCVSVFGRHPYESGSAEQTVEAVAARGKMNIEIKEAIIERGLHPLLKMLELYPIKRFITPEKLKDAWISMEAEG